MIAVEESFSTRISMPGCEVVDDLSLEESPGDSTQSSESCLCNRLNAIEVLEARHCTFESLYDSLKKDARGHSDEANRAWATGLKYLRVEGATTRFAERAYDVFRVHERLWADRFADVKLIRLPGLQLRVSGGLRTTAPPVTLSFAYSLDERQFLEFKNCPVDPEKYALYARVDAVLRDEMALAGLSLEQAIHILDRRLRFAAGSDTSPQYTMFIDSLLRDLRSTDELKGRVFRQRAGLWDAPVLAEFAMQPLEEHLANWPRLRKAIEPMRPESRVNLLNALLPLEEYQAVQNYTGAIRLCERCLLF
jgi:hypothetical protein